MQYRPWPILGLLLLLAILSLLPISDGIIHAQGGVLSYGTTATGSITADMPLALYSFSGTAEDLIHLDAISLSGELQPAVDLLAPDRQIIASSRPNTLAETPYDTTLSMILPTTGVYSLMIGGVDGSTGDYALQLAGRNPTPATPLTFGLPLPVSIPQNAAPQYFPYVAEDCPTTLTVYDIAPGTPYTYPFVVTVRDERGQMVATLRGGETVEDRVTVPPLSGSYEAAIWSADPALAGSLALVVTCAGDAPPCVSSEPAIEVAECVCPNCDDFGECADFAIGVEISEHSVVTVTWPAVEGATAGIVSMTDETGAIVYARMVTDALIDTIDLNWWGIGPGTYDIRVTVGSEVLGYNVCGDLYTLEFEGQGPADWGIPEELPEECAVDIIAPRETMANGLQTFFWTDVPGAESYRLRVYGQFDATVADGAITAPATSLTMDVSEASIGAGYGGEDDFYIQINAYREGESWCANGVRVLRNP